MKKICVLTVLLTVFLCSCSINNSTSVTLIGNINGYTTNKLNIPLESGYYCESVDWLNENNLIIVLEKIEKGSDEYPTERKKILKYNIETQKTKTVYEGEFIGGISNRIKFLDNKTICLQVSNSLLYFDSGFDSLLSINNLDKMISSPQVFTDGNQMLYRTWEGVFILNLKNMQKINVAVKKGIELLGPQLSSSDIILYGDITLDMVKAIIYEPITNRREEYNIMENNIDSDFGHIFWFNNNQKILFHLKHREEGSKYILSILDLKDKSVRNISVDYSLIHDIYDNKLLYTYNKGNDRIYLYNLNTDKTIIITPDFVQIEGSKFSPDGNSIVYEGTSVDYTKSLYVTQLNKD